MFEVTVNVMLWFPTPRLTFDVREPVPVSLPILIVAFGSIVVTDIEADVAAAATFAVYGSGIVRSAFPSMEIALKVVLPSTVTLSV